MNILRYPILLLLLLSILMLGSTFFIIPKSASAEISDEDAAATLRAYNAKKWGEAIDAGDDQAAADAIQAGKNANAAQQQAFEMEQRFEKEDRQIKNSKGGLESSKSTDSGSSGWQGGGSFGEGGNNNTGNSGGVENDYGGGGGGGGSDASNHNGQTTNVRHGSDSHTNNTYTSNQSSSNNSKVDNNRRATKGVFGRIFDKISNFFKGLTRGTSNKKDEPTVARDSLFPTQNYSRKGADDTDSESKSMDLVPYTTSAQITQGKTTFSGKIVLNQNSQNTTCKDGDKIFTEGYQKGSLSNSDGSVRSIADANFVCRSGEWKIEGGLPVPTPKTTECTKEYAPVCGIKPWSCNAPSGASCNAPERSSLETTYGNKCEMEAAGASFEREGTCSGSETQVITGDVLGEWTSNVDESYTRAPSDGKRYILGSANNESYITSPRRTQASELTNKLLIDYSCDGSVDVEQEFTTPYKTLRSGNNSIIPLSVRASNAPEGNHCFAFKVDTTNVVSETNESNNQSNWKTFTVSSTVVPTETSVICPQYQQPICGSNEVTISGTVGSDGCQTAPFCVTVSSGDAGPDDIMFEVKSYVLSDPAAGGTTARITVKEWSPEDITLGKYQKLAFRWSAYNYDSCLASIYPEKYVFDGNTTSITGNTENSGIAIKGLSRVYSVECTTGDITYKKEINVQAQY